jgi:YD repeat-containing protein
VLLTALRDPHGNALTFTWDASLRLVAATDALGQVTTLDYADTDPLKITKITDPFGRYAMFVYDAAGRLQSITDVIGLQSSFTYGTADIVKTLTMPYGTTTFTTGEKGIARWADHLEWHAHLRVGRPQSAGRGHCRDASIGIQLRRRATTGPRSREGWRCHAVGQQSRLKITSGVSRA